MYKTIPAAGGMATGR